MKPKVLTGDRPSGRLHTGHYAGTLRRRFSMQTTHRCFFMIADYQALTTRSNQSNEVERHVSEMVLDYLAAGFDPEHASCFLQSQVPQLAELTTIFGNLVNLTTLLEIPSVKEKNMTGSEPCTYGYVGFPVSQAADILLFRPDFVPVGESQRPFVDLARNVAKRFNQIYGEIFPLPEGIYRNKLIASKGVKKKGNMQVSFLELSASADDVLEFVEELGTDHARNQASDPGIPENCPVFGYHQIFSQEIEQQVAGDCRNAHLECGDCKSRLASNLNELLEEFRERRAKFEQKPHVIRDVLNLGASEARIEGQRTLEAVKGAMGLSYCKLLA